MHSKETGIKSLLARLQIHAFTLTLDFLEYGYRMILFYVGTRFCTDSSNASIRIFYMHITFSSRHLNKDVPEVLSF